MYRKMSFKHARRLVSCLRTWTESRPKLALCIMLAAITVSVGYVLKVPRERTSPARQNVDKVSAPVAEGLSGIAATAAMLGELFELQAMVGTISAGDTLAEADSLLLIEALGRMDELEKRLGKADKKTNDHED